MISLIPQEDILLNWKFISEVLGKYWNKTENFETLPNLKKRLLGDDCQLWLYSSDRYYMLFVSETDLTATATVFRISHCGGLNRDGRRWKKQEVIDVGRAMFKDIEQLAKNIGHTHIVIQARDGNELMVDGYKRMPIPIMKKL